MEACKCFLFKWSRLDGNEWLLGRGADGCCLAFCTLGLKPFVYIHPIHHQKWKRKRKRKVKKLFPPHKLLPNGLESLEQPITMYVSSWWKVALHLYKIHSDSYNELWTRSQAPGDRIKESTTLCYWLFPFLQFIIEYI